MGKLKDKICVDGYNPFNGFNIFLSAVGGIDWMYIIFFIATGEYKALFQDMGIIILLVGLCCFLLLLFRNRKLKSVPKMIIFSLLSMILGAVIVVVGFIVYLLLAMFGGGTSSVGNAMKQFSSASGTSGNKNNNGQDTGFSKQDDLNAQMQGYANAQQYQDSTGFSGHDINPDDDYTRA